MDVWNDKLVSSFADLVESTTGSKHTASPPVAIAEGEGEGDGDGKGKTEEKSEEKTVPHIVETPIVGSEEKQIAINLGAVSASESASESDSDIQKMKEIKEMKGPELIVELQCTTESQISRLMISLGIDPALLGKAPKDQQAAVKTLETDLAVYAELLQEIPVPEPEPIVAVEGEGEGNEVTNTNTSTKEPAVEKKEGEEIVDEENLENPAKPEFTHSHPAVLDMASNGARRLLRLKTDEISIALTKTKVAIDLLEAHGTIGWLSTEETDDFVTTPIVESELVEGEGKGKGESESKGGAEEGSKEKEKEGEEKEKEAAAPAAVETSVAVEVIEVAIAVEEADLSPQGRSKKRIADSLNAAKDSNKEMLVNKAADLSQYLLAQVMPELARGMVDIAKNQPVDPIMYVDMGWLYLCVLCLGATAVDLSVMFDV